MISEKNGQSKDLSDLLSPAVSGSYDTIQKELLTYHRRGHWFKSSIAHHRGNIITNLQS